MFFNKLSLPNKDNALVGRDAPMQIDNKHFVTGRPIQGDFLEMGYQSVQFGLGCFWGAERKFWLLDGVYTTAVGYAAGFTPNPSYREVCSGQTGHNEVVLVVYDPSVITFKGLLKTFFESHNPTQGMRQGNDKGTQYRSAIYYQTAEQKKDAEQVLTQYQGLLLQHAPQAPKITTEILPAGEFYYAEQDHQQYLAKVPNGYCGLGGVGVECDIEL